MRDSVLAALMALLVAVPFFANVLNKPAEFALRFEQTSVFAGDTATHLPYYRAGMATPQLALEQLLHSIGVVNQLPDAGGFWPTLLHLVPAALALLTLRGIDWCSRRWRDPRSVALAIWFWVSMSGVITTVETPTLQRMATTFPILTLFPALVLVNMAQRVERLVRLRGDRLATARRIPRQLSVLGAALLVAALQVYEGSSNFRDYARMERWPYPNAEGAAVSAQGSSRWVISLGLDYHRINQGGEWLLPGGVASLVPFTVLSPPPSAGVENALPISVLGQRE